MLQQWLSVVEGAVVLLLAVAMFNYGGAGLKWCRLTPALRRTYRRIPKGSLGWPLLGETLAFQHALMSTSPHTFVTDRRRRYGSDMFLTHLFGIPLLASTDPEISKLILTKEEKFMPTLPNNIKMAVGENAILLMQGERHKRLRRMVMTLLSPDTLKYHLSYILELASCTLQGWTGRKVILEDEAREFTFLVNLRLMFHTPGDQRSKRFHDKFMDLRRNIRSLPIDLPGTSYRKAKEARKALNEILEEFIAERKGAKETKFPDLLGKLVHAEEEDGGDQLTNDEIIDVILSTMLAGVDTSSNTLIFLVYYIGQHPNLHQDLKVEHEEILRDKEPNDPLNWSDYKKMKLTQFTINETLRLANPILSLHRKAVEDFEHNGSFVPAGCQVQVWLRTIHTDPKIYPQPYNFDISRWKGKAITNNFYPFGVGPRQCVGAELARLQLCLFVHSLVTTYSWEMIENDTPKYFPEPGMTKGLPIRVTEV